MKSVDKNLGEANAATPDEDTWTGQFGGMSVGLLLALLCLIVLVMDYSDLIFSDSRRRDALDLIKPGMRLTQAERTLNSAGYQTLYIEENPPLLQVSSLSRLPITADLFHKVLPNSAPDKWLLSKISGRTRFYVAGEAGGMVNFDSDGNPAFFRGFGDNLIDDSYFSGN